MAITGVTETDAAAERSCFAATLARYWPPVDGRTVVDHAPSAPAVSVVKSDHSLAPPGCRCSITTGVPGYGDVPLSAIERPKRTIVGRAAIVTLPVIPSAMLPLKFRVPSWRKK